MPAEGSGLCDGNAGGWWKGKKKEETKGAAGSFDVVVLRTSRVYYYGLRHGMGADMEGTM